MTTTTRRMRPPMGWWTCTGPRAAAACAFAVFAAAGCAGSDAAPRAADAEIGPATRTFARSEVLSVATLAELATLSDVVVEARVEDVDHGPSMSDGEGLDYLVLTLEVLEGYKGATRGEVLEVLTVGIDPDDGAVYTGEGEHWPGPETTGLWYLGTTEAKALSGYTYVRTSAGQILRTAEGIAETGGDQQAAAVLCGVPWNQAKAMVARSVVAAAGAEPLAVGEASPSADPSFAGNPCAGHGREDETEVQATGPEKE